jgi:hypothetical protein
MDYSWPLMAALDLSFQDRGCIVPVLVVASLEVAPFSTAWRSFRLDEYCRKDPKTLGILPPHQDVQDGLLNGLVVSGNPERFQFWP